MYDIPAVRYSTAIYYKGRKKHNLIVLQSVLVLHSLAETMSLEKLKRVKREYEIFIFKTGSKAEVNNYHPISILFIFYFSKTFKKLVVAIHNILHNNHYLIQFLFKIIYHAHKYFTL